MIMQLMPYTLLIHALYGKKTHALNFFHCKRNPYRQGKRRFCRNKSKTWPKIALLQRVMFSMALFGNSFVKSQSAAGEKGLNGKAFNI